jgi:cell division inhibitor SepF
MGFIDDLKEKLRVDSLNDEVYEEIESTPDDTGTEELEVARTATYESPHGTDSSTVVRRPRTPDVKRASELTGGTVREVPRTAAKVAPMAREQTLIHNARPTSFNDCGLIADRFKGRQPVIIDLTAIPLPEQQRFLDFIAGLIYGLNGEISKVSVGIYLITPHGSAISDVDRARFSSRTR